MQSAPTRQFGTQKPANHEFAKPTDAPLTFPFEGHRTLAEVWGNA